MRICVVGTGYLGATHAACLASMNHEVTGFDVDPERVRVLASGRAPFHEAGLDPMIGTGIESGRLRFSTEPSSLRRAEAVFLCVGTPQRRGGADTDLSAVWNAVELLARFAPHSALVVGKSTVPVGTAVHIRDALSDRWGSAAQVAWNPEFLREGHAVEDSLRPERLVLGVESDAAYARLLALYAPLVAADVVTIRTDLATAELAKVSANVMLAARLSVVNVLAESCAAAGGRIEDLIRILASDSRIGPQFLAPGIGYGGSCLPKDTRAFLARSAELAVGDSLGLIHEVDNVNMRQRARAVNTALRVLPGGSGDLAVLGAAFKGGSDDVRDSPALDIAAALHEQGASVTVFDQAANESAARAHPELRFAASVEEACRDADAVMVLTDWDEFAALDPVALAMVVRRTEVIDGRLLLDAEKWRAAGWTLHRTGM